MKAGMRSVLAVLAGLVTAPLPTSAETLRIGGTGAVTALLQTMAGPFAAYSPQDNLEVLPGLGSSGGTAAVEAGALTMAVTGRALRPNEIAAGLKIIPFLETPFVFVADSKAPLSLARKDLIDIYTGATVKYPDGMPLRLILRPRSDAQTLLMINAIDGMAAALEKARLRPELPIAGNDQDNMEIASRLSGAFSGFPLTQLLSEPNTLRHVALDGSMPTLAAMKAGTYTLKLKVDFIVKGEPSPLAKRFLTFMASPEALAIIEKSGAAPLPAP